MVSFRTIHVPVALFILVAGAGLTGCPLLFPNQGAALGVDPLSLDFGSTSTALTVQVSNMGTGTLQWKVRIDPEDTPWLSIDPAEGKGAGAVTVSVDRSKLTQNAQASLVFTAINGTRNELSIPVTVARPKGPAPITVSPKSCFVAVNQTQQLSASSSLPGDKISWTSSNPAVASVNASTGLVTGIAANSNPAIITATGSPSGATATAQVHVVRVMIGSSNQPLPIGKPERFTASSTYAGDTAFTWASDNTAVATVDSLGIVRAAALGTATIRATGIGSGISATKQLTVVTAPAGLLIFDGETPFTTNAETLRGTANAHNGAGCLEGLPTLYKEPDLNLQGLSSSRADVSGFDEIWFFARATEAGHALTFGTVGNNLTSNRVNVLPYIEGGALDGAWRLVRLPMSALVTPTYLLTRIDRLYFGKADTSSGYHVFVDDVWAVNTRVVDPAASPLVVDFHSLDFGGVTAGASAGPRIATVHNAGTADLVVDNLTVSDDSQHEFALDTASFSLAPGGSRDLPVTFAPKSAGDRLARLVLWHNKTPMGEWSAIDLAGQGLGPQIEVSPATLDFGAVAQDRQAVLTLLLDNHGNQPLHLSNIAPSDPAFTVEISDAEVAPGAQTPIEITFTPAAQQAYAGMLTFTSDDPMRPSLAVALSGTGLASGAQSQLAIQVEETTSSTVELGWPRLHGVTRVRVFVGPEPPTSNPGPLPLQKQIAEVPGTDTGVIVAGLAPAAHTFFYAEGWGPAEGEGEDEALAAIGAAHTQTAGGPRAKLDSPVREVHLYAPNVLAVVITDLMVHSYTAGEDSVDRGIDSVVGNTGADLEAGSWTVQRADGTPIQVVHKYRQSIPVGQPYYDVAPPVVYENRLDVDHWIYLVLDTPVGARELLEVTGPTVTRNTLTLTRLAGQEVYQPSFLLPFSDLYLETPVLQVNQVGYCPRATERYAYVCGWMGDGGPLSLANFPAAANVLAEPADPMAERVQALGALPLANRSTSGTQDEAGGAVRDIDLSALPAAEGTVYRVQLPGVGVSWPTAVSESAVYKAFYVTSRGMYLNRWGRDLRPQWTDWSPRKPDHSKVFTSEVTEWDIETAAFTPDMPQIDPRPLAGGHHDAGDFDIRPQHFLNAMLTMRAFELNESAFDDGQLDIPESGNGIPDYLDEILYSLKGWEDLQEPDGGVRAGAQSYSHPQRINYADADTMPYWVFAVDANHTMRVSAMFAQASRLVRPYDTAKADDLEIRALLAHQYALDHGVTESLGGPFMYAAGELFRAGGDPAYRTIFETLWNEGSQENYGNGPVMYGFASWGWEGDKQAILLDYILGYLTGAAKDPSILDQAVTILNAMSDEAVDTVHNAHAHRNGRPADWNTLAGHGTAVGEYLMRIYARMQLAGEAPIEPERQQEFLNAISLSADFVLGCNPQGLVWITGLGSRSPHDLLHHDSLAFAHDMGLPVVPGIPVYGYGVLQGQTYYDYGKRVIYPEFDQVPLLRRFMDIRTFVTLTEFTVWQTQAPQTALFGTLVGAGLHTPEAWRPGHPLHRATLPGREDATAKK